MQSHTHVMKGVNRKKVLYFPGSLKHIVYGVFRIYYVCYFNENASGMNFLFLSRASQSLPLDHTLPKGSSALHSCECYYKTEFTSCGSGVGPVWKRPLVKKKNRPLSTKHARVLLFFGASKKDV